MKPFEEVEFPAKGWRPKRGPRARRALAGEALLTEAEQAQYDQLIGTVKSGRGLRVYSPYPDYYRNTGAIKSAVRIRLFDLEGYAPETKREDEEYIIMRLVEEHLICSAYGCNINAVNTVRMGGARLRRGDECPFHVTSGVLRTPKKARRKK
jgi:hypothetical protein